MRQGETVPAQSFRGGDMDENRPKPIIPALTKQNLLDKAIAYVLPGVAVKRNAHRNKLALTGGYAGARVDLAQLSRWTPAAGSANADIILDLPMLRARSRDQMRNAPVALGALNTMVSHVIGTGLSYNPAIDAKFLRLTDDQKETWQQDVKRRFLAWAESSDCDVARQLDFYGIQELAFRSHLESGDCFVLTPRIARSGKPPRLALQLIEADRVCNPNRNADTESMIAGVEIAINTGEAIAYHVAKQHPGANTHLVSTNSWTRIAARGSSTGRRNVLPIFKQIRPGQVRGVPWIAPILEPLKQLNRWTEAELNAAVVSGLMALFITMDPEAFEMLLDEKAKSKHIARAQNWSGAMESGKAVALMPGEKVESPAPGRPNPDFDPFWIAMVRQIGMALEMPYEVLVMHFQSSYSAARGAMLMAWKSFRTRRDFLAKTLCQPVFELWLADEVAEGRIHAPGFFTDDVVRAAWCAAVWTGDGPGSIDPLKDAQAATLRVNLGISTKEAESLLHDGVDWEKKHAQRVKETNAEKRDGIYVLPEDTKILSDFEDSAEKNDQEKPDPEENGDENR
uniref:Phage portal protein, lambda family n=1 Tax=Candidatus Nitrotoga fabula TaxID=2182327 RepID=A0A2X0QVQ5_9PROT|nr:Phage portal protein, lambda family [Candidatus Nitrotoga fabula]